MARPRERAWSVICARTAVMACPVVSRSARTCKVNALCIAVGQFMCPRTCSGWSWK
jgi:hypothetical protein